jgi:hypothetical protein
VHVSCTDAWVTGIVLAIASLGAVIAALVLGEPVGWEVFGLLFLLGLGVTWLAWFDSDQLLYRERLRARDRGLIVQRTIEQFGEDVRTEKC